MGRFLGKLGGGGTNPLQAQHVSINTSLLQYDFVQNMSWHLKDKKILAEGYMSSMDS